MADGGISKVRKYPFLPVDSEQGWLPYMWLVYLLNFLLPAVFSPDLVRVWWLSAGTLAIFLPLYFRSYWEQGWRQFALSAAMCVIGLAWARWNLGSSVFVVFAVAGLVHDDDQRAAWRRIAILVAFTGLASWLLGLRLWFWLPALGFSLFVAAFIAESRKRHRLSRRLGLAEDEVGRLARIAERERIARDLHDLLGHTLSLIVLKSELASKLAETDPVRTAAEIRDVERISREALSEVRAAVAGYRSSGLNSELDHARETLHSMGIEFESNVEPVTVSPSQESVLAMAIREAITNIVRHAGARSCRLTLRQRLSSCELEISDDGKGGLAPDGLGVIGMRERVEALGGTLERDGTEGMRLLLRLPVAGPAAAL
jgi:two-component system sensor histidine kinase DesK